MNFAFKQMSLYFNTKVLKFYLQNFQNMVINVLEIGIEDFTNIDILKKNREIKNVALILITKGHVIYYYR